MNTNTSKSVYASISEPFWANNPSVLLNNEHIFEIWPNKNMSYEQKMNAISRLIIFLTILGYVMTTSKKILYVGVATLVVVYGLYVTRKTAVSPTEAFEGGTDGDSNHGRNGLITVLPNDNELSNAKKNDTYLNPVTLESVLRSEFKDGTKKNPFSNVLLTEISDDPDRKSAPPAFNVDVEQDITKNVKRTVQMLNPGIKNTSKQLFGDLWQKFQLDESNRAFYSMPNTRVGNDQGAFAEYLYSDLKYSGKESTPEGAFARVQDNWRWIMM